MSPEKLKNLETKIFCPDFSDFSERNLPKRKIDKNTKRRIINKDLPKMTERW